MPDGEIARVIGLCDWIPRLDFTVELVRAYVDGLPRFARNAKHEQAQVLLHR